MPRLKPEPSSKGVGMQWKGERYRRPGAVSSQGSRSCPLMSSLPEVCFPVRCVTNTLGALPVRPPFRREARDAKLAGVSALMPVKTGSTTR
jgi:hypothetical protein